MPSSTPTPTLDGFTLLPATPAQDLIATKREHVEWGAPLLSQDQFITREKNILDKTDFSLTRRRRWVLVPVGNEETEDFFAACETYRRPILVSRGGDVRRGLAYSVCSVFVPEEKRHKGFAGKMMSLLQMNLNPAGRIPEMLGEGRVAGSKSLGVALEEELGEEGYGGNATCSFLYSDIGEYYSQFGWKIVGPRHVSWPPLSAAETPSLPEGARWLTSDELQEVAALDRSYLLSQLQQPSSGVRFCLDDPKATSWRWLISRSNFYATTLLPPSSPHPTHFALLLSEQSYVVWMFDFIERKIAILRLRYSSPSDFVTLVTAVRGEAARFGMEKVVAWNPNLHTLGVELGEEDEKLLAEGKEVGRCEKELSGGKVVERKGSGASLPALAWYGDREEGEEVRFDCNEYGWWC